MSAFVRFLIGLAANMAWRRIGGGGAAPPVRLPRSKGPIPVPVLTPWQMMVGMWVARKVWNSFGDRVKSTLESSGHPAARQVGTWLPDTPGASGAAKGTAAPGTTMTPPRVWTTTAQPAPPQSGAAGASAPHQAPAQPPTQRQYNTQRLEDQGTTDPSSTSGAQAQNNSSSQTSGRAPFWRRGSSS
jgi:hypothetical protein